VPDLITIVPEPRQIEGNQQDLVKWEQSDLPSLCSFYSPFAAIHHNSYDTGMTLQTFASGQKFLNATPVPNPSSRSHVAGEAGPPEAVREVLEAVANDDIDQEFAIGLFNRRTASP